MAGIPNLGETWSSRTGLADALGESPGTSDFDVLRWVGDEGVFVAMATNQKKLLTSSNGADWTDHSSNLPTGTLRSYCWDGTYHCLGGYTGTFNVPGFWRSTDLVTWSLTDLTGHGFASGNNYIFKMASDGAGTIVAGGQSGKIAESANNGTTWTNETAGPSYLVGDVEMVDYNPTTGRFYAGAYSTTARLITSDNGGVSWTSRNASFDDIGAAYPYKMIYADTRLICIMNGGDLSFSTDDGNTWTNDTTSLDTWFGHTLISTDNWGVYVGGKLIMSGLYYSSSQNGTIAISTDDLVTLNPYKDYMIDGGWTITNRARQIASDGFRLVVVGNNCELATSP
jgi:hypothetical protein